MRAKTPFRETRTLGVLGILMVPAGLFAQQSSRVAIVATTGLGWTTADTTFNGSAVYGVGVGVGYRLFHTVDLELALDVAGGIGQGDIACVGNVPCPVSFVLRGASIGLAFAPSTERGSRWFAGLGAGAYRVTAKRDPSRDDPSCTKVGFHASGGVAVGRWRGGSIGLGARVALIPDARGESLWTFIPFEVTARLRL